MKRLVVVQHHLVTKCHEGIIRPIRTVEVLYGKPTHFFPFFSYGYTLYQLGKILRKDLKSQIGIEFFVLRTRHGKGVLGKQKAIEGIH